MKYPSEQWDPGTGGGGSTSFATVTLASMATVTEGTLGAGEDLVADVTKVEMRYTPTNLTSATTLNVKPAAGFLHGFYVGAISCPSTILYDGLLPSGTVLTRIACGMPLGFHPFNGTFANGLTADAIAGGGGVAPFISFLTR